MGMSYGKMSENEMLMNLLEMDEWAMPEITEDYDFDTWQDEEAGAQSHDDTENCLHAEEYAQLNEIHLEDIAESGIGATDGDGIVEHAIDDKAKVGQQENDDDQEGIVYGQSIT